MAVIISVVNNKGGVGKTTTTVNLADALARLGLRVLVMDIDPQSDASGTIGRISPFQIKRNMESLLLDESVPLAATIDTDTRIPGVDLVYSHINLTSTDEKLRVRSMEPARELAHKVSGAVDAYDVVLIDTPPQLSMLMANALAASDYYLIPMESGSQYSLEGMEELIRYVQRILKIQPKLQRLGVLLTKHDGRRTVCQAITAAVHKEYPDVFTTRISSSTKVSQSQVYQQSVLQMDRRANVSREFADLAREVVARLNIPLPDQTASVEVAHG